MVGYAARTKPGRRLDWHAEKEAEDETYLQRVSHVGSVFGKPGLHIPLALAAGTGLSVIALLAMGVAKSRVTNTLTGPAPVSGLLVRNV